jgi:hypothetical protein
MTNVAALSCYRENMTDQVRAYTKKKRPEAPGTMVGVRLQPVLLSVLDNWRKHQEVELSRPQAIRKLIAGALCK